LLRGSSFESMYSRPSGPTTVHLGHALARFFQAKVGSIAGQDVEAVGSIGLHLVAIKLVAEASIENPGNDSMDAVLPIHPAIVHALELRAQSNLRSKQ
jgi:hypothetical protein